MWFQTRPAGLGVDSWYACVCTMHMSMSVWWGTTVENLAKATVTYPVLSVSSCDCGSSPLVFACDRVQK